MKREGGFTLIELIITLVIAGVLVAIGVPNLAEFLKNSTRTTRLNDIVTALNYARSESVKRNTEIRVCSTTDFATCAASTSFTSGYMVLDISQSAVLRVFQTDISGDTTIIASTTQFDYQGDGFPATGSPATATFTYCDDRGASDARAVIISTTGHPRISRDTDGNGIHEAAGGGNLTCPP